MPLYNKTILIISPESWGTSFVSKHHYATILAERGNKVYFLNPPSQKSEITTINEQLKIIDYQLVMRGINRMPTFLRNLLNGRQIAKIKRQFIPEDIDIVWSFDPFRFQKLTSWGAKTAIYHPVDIHKTNLDLPTAASADIIFSTAALILEKFAKTLPNTPQFKINHGLAAHFIAPDIVPVSFSDNFKLRVGYVGNLNYPYLDKNTLLNVIKANPNIGFYFIGPHEKSNLSASDTNNTDFISQLQNLPNTVLLGAKPSKELPNYLAAFDLFLMTYTADQHRAELANPHKILEYLSTGKIVVSHYIDEYGDKNHLVAMAQTNADIPALFDKTVAQLLLLNSPTLREMRKDYARENTYQAQVVRIEQHLDALKK
jgi:glycosyltransferase involved in cell wall biosynthesis